jgi:hypothetical protein
MTVLNKIKNLKSALKFEDLMNSKNKSHLKTLLYFAHKEITDTWILEPHSTAPLNIT